MNRHLCLVTVVVFGLYSSAGSCLDNVLQGSKLANSTSALLQTIEDTDVVEKTKNLLRGFNASDTQQRVENLRDTFEPVVDKAIQDGTLFDAFKNGLQPWLNAFNATTTSTTAKSMHGKGRH